MSDCVFCRILKGEEPAEIIMSSAGATTIVPLNPVTEGHTITISHLHVRDAVEDPHGTGYVMAQAAALAAHRGVGSCNFITSVGREATQSIFHLHVHTVPRREGDGLALPWDVGVPSDTGAEVSASATA